MIPLKPNRWRIPEESGAEKWNNGGRFEARRTAESMRNISRRSDLVYRAAQLHINLDTDSDLDFI